MKAVISNRIYIELNPDQDREIREKLTYRIPTYGDGPPMIINNYTVFRKGILSLPVGRTDLIPNDYEIVDKRVLNPVEFPEFRGTLRDSQEEICVDVNDNCLINAKVGYGKTFLALALAYKLKQKTLVVVHTLPLMYQWAEEVEKVFGFKPGLIGAGKEDFSKIITIGNVASLYKRMPKLGKEFGLLVMDEVHHAPSPTFSKIVDSCFARYKVGLSGTLQRKDGLHVLLPDYFGFKVYKPIKENTVDPIIHAYDTHIQFPYGDIWAYRVNALNESQLYTEWLINTARRYEKLGHKVLIVSDRVDFLQRISKELGSALIIGGTDDRKAQFQLLEDGLASSICGSMSIFKEGISYNPLSCVILATPINNLPMLEQVIGRIQRLHPGKLNPIVVDPILRGRTTERQFINRTGFYLKEGFEIKYL